MGFLEGTLDMVMRRWRREHIPPGSQQLGTPGRHTRLSQYRLSTSKEGLQKRQTRVTSPLGMRMASFIFIVDIAGEGRGPSQPLILLYSIANSMHNASHGNET